MNPINRMNPLQVATETPSKAEFMRLPKPKERDPIFGLSRSYLNNMVLPCAENRYQPPVRSIVVRRPGAKTGVRLVDISSLRQYLLAHVEPTFQLRQLVPIVPFQEPRLQTA